jgi:DNA processing protein
MTAGAGEAVILARAYLSRVAEPASIPVWDWVRRHGPVAAAESIQAGDVPTDVARATAARRTAVRVDDDLAVAERFGIRLVVPEGPEWPHFAFSALEAVARTRLALYRAGERTQRPGGELIPPLALWARGSGDLSHAAVRAVAIVGSRSASATGARAPGGTAFGWFVKTS